MSCHSQYSAAMWAPCTLLEWPKLEKTRCWLKLPSLKFKVNMLYLVFGARTLNWWTAAHKNAITCWHVIRHPPDSGLGKYQLESLKIFFRSSKQKKTPQPSSAVRSTGWWHAAESVSCRRVPCGQFLFATRTVSVERGGPWLKRFVLEDGRISSQQHTATIQW